MSACHFVPQYESVTTTTSTDSSPLSPTDRTTVRRSKERAQTDRDELHSILRDGMFCHLGVVVTHPEGPAPVVLPTTYGVDLDSSYAGPDGTVYLHGSVAARSLVSAPEQTVCVTVTHVDGLVLARSGFHHSANYRCAVIFGRPRLVADPEERLHALRLLVEQVVPGRWDSLRPPTRKDLAATTVLALSLTEASVKRRDGGVNDEPEDVGLPIWAGVLPLHTTAGPVETSADCDPSLGVPDHVQDRASSLRFPRGPEV